MKEKPNEKMIERYYEALRNVPPSGGGGCHKALLSVANYGVLAGLSADVVFADLRQSVHGDRHVKDAEIQSAIEKAFKDHDAYSPIQLASGEVYRRPRPVVHRVNDGAAVVQKLIAEGSGFTEQNFFDLSPIKPNKDSRLDSQALFEALFEPNDLIFVGGRLEAGVIGENICTAKRWVENFSEAGSKEEFIIPNPLSGQAAPKASGEGQTFRGDACVTTYRFAVAEFDSITRDEQLAFWSRIKLPISALIDSGGKSLHAWIDVKQLAPNVTNAESWADTIKERLYRQLLEPMGADPCCKNPARLSRLPGHFRQDKNRWQRLLFLSPEGVTVCNQ